MCNPDHGDIARRYYEEVFNKGNLLIADEVLHPEYTQRSLHYRGSAHHLVGPQSIKEQAAKLRATYPDFHYDIEKIVAEGDTVVVCGIVHGTYTVRRNDGPTEKRPISYASIHILRFQDGRIIEDWNLWDSAGWRQQLDGIMRYEV